MTDAPKTIWACPEPSGPCMGWEIEGYWHIDPSIGEVQYTLTSTVAAQLKAADELADAVAGMQASCGISTLGLTQALTAYRKAKDKAQ